VSTRPSGRIVETEGTPQVIRATKVFEDGINLKHLNYLLAFDGVIASRGGIPLIEQGAIIGAIGCSGGADSQDEVVSKAGAAVINQLPATNK